MKITSNIVGKFSSEEVISYEIRNSKGFGINVLNYGGIITDVIAPDKNGNLENVVMKYKDMNIYEENPSYYGALIGRTAGRIFAGEVKLNNKILKLNKNYGFNQGHGGNIGFDKKLMKAKMKILEDKAFVELKYFSPNNEEGYPGNLNIAVRYTVTEDNTFKISYKGVSDEDTLLNLTNHSYFNLSGNKNETILDHHLYIDSDFLVELDETQAPTGNIININGSAFDFTIPKLIGRDIEEDDLQLRIGQGYDHPWILNGGKQVKLRLYHKPSGRVMDVYTNHKSVVLYSLNFPDDKIVEGGHLPKRRGAIAIETQSPPIGKNSCFANHSILKKDEEYSKETIYKFDIMEK
ncbi:aldose epimerase family protein [Clostridium septicum]|uniref:aldose epimerase family protein n=1 Tax=Clostridium septicum TaxID=1504 RepID=UPI00272E5B3D|nr:aldose epimerase family protein [Clostridium septicum]WLF68433.1 aldose epimerase family protein [Clostridium septicum]